MEEWNYGMLEKWKNGSRIAIGGKDGRMERWEEGKMRQFDPR
jgi:hypothetical protein